MAQLPEGITELMHHQKLRVPLVSFVQNDVAQFKCASLSFPFCIR